MRMHRNGLPVAFRTATSHEWQTWKPGCLACPAAAQVSLGFAPYGLGGTSRLSPPDERASRNPFWPFLTSGAAKEM